MNACFEAARPPQKCAKHTVDRNDDKVCKGKNTFILKHHSYALLLFNELYLLYEIVRARNELGTKPKKRENHIVQH